MRYRLGLMGGVGAGRLYGTLELLILKGLEAHGPMHGVAVADHIGARSGGLFKIEEGSLYPALHRLQGKGYVAWEWMKTEEGKRAKYYQLTADEQRDLLAKHTREDFLAEVHPFFKKGKSFKPSK